MNRKVTVLLVVLLVLAVLTVAWARAYVLGASGYNSNGSLIAGWHWLRSPGHTATWVFEVGALEGSQNIYLNLNPLVTNGVSGGAGFDTSIKFTIVGATTYNGIANVVNPFRPIDPANSGGVGYPCYGHSTVPIPPAVFRGCKVVKVIVSYPFPAGRHVAVNKGCASFGYSK